MMHVFYSIWMWIWHIYIYIYLFIHIKCDRCNISNIKFNISYIYIYTYRYLHVYTTYLYIYIYRFITRISRTRIEKPVAIQKPYLQKTSRFWGVSRKVDWKNPLFHSLPGVFGSLQKTKGLHISIKDHQMVSGNIIIACSMPVHISGIKSDTYPHLIERDRDPRQTAWNGKLDEHNLRKVQKKQRKDCNYGNL